MNLIYLAILCSFVATSFVHKSETKLHDESIVGGIVASLGQHSYAVSIQKNNFHYCSGGILNNRHVISAAHCFIAPNNRFENHDYSVVAGVTNAHNIHAQYRVMREVAKIYIPRDYNPIMVPNVQRITSADIAVLELASYLDLNMFISNVVLPRIAMQYPSYENEQAVVCGYGHNWVNVRRNPHTNRNVEVGSGSYSYERRYAEVKITSNMACRQFWTDITDSELCGNIRQRLGPANPEGLCAGDSGAPLVIGNTIIGVVSDSPTGCREDIDPAVYTRVTSFLPFVTYAMNGFRTANMRLAKYIRTCDLFCRKKLVEQ